jgi:molybdenum cofactor cytidylyltransferase
MAKPLVAVLAAGRARRFGGRKLEVECAGKPLGRWIIEAVEQAGLGPGVIVTGPEGVSFADGWHALVNFNPRAGLGSSLGLAARYALENGDDTMLVLLADMPLVTAAYLRELSASSAPAATRYLDGRAGVPALFDRSLIGQARGLSGDRGAGPLLAGALLHEAPAGSLHDVDTLEDLSEVARALTV